MDSEFVKEMNNRFLDSLSDTVGHRYYINVETEPELLGTKLMVDLGYLPDGSYTGDANKSKYFIEEHNFEFAKLWDNLISQVENNINPYLDYEQIEIIVMEKFYNMNFEKVMNKLNSVAREHDIDLDNLDRNCLLVDSGFVNFASYALDENYNELLFDTYLDDLHKRTNPNTTTYQL